MKKYLIFIVIIMVSCQRDEFSIVILPDTQNYTRNDWHHDKTKNVEYNHKWVFEALNTYTKQTEWIVEQREDRNIKFVMHMGDVVNNVEDSNELKAHFQYQVASSAHQKLEEAEPEVPYSITTGNHDLFHDDDLTRGTSHFNQYFGPDRFEGKDWYAGPRLYGKNESNLTFFEASGLNFMVISLEHFPPKDAICWADELLTKAEYQDKQNSFGDKQKHMLKLTHTVQYEQYKQPAVKDRVAI